jgi:hypothetical protein
MPLDMMPYAQQAADYGFVPIDHETPKYFGVEAVEIYDPKGTAIAGHKAIKRMDTYDTLAVHSDSYHPILDADIFGAFEAALNRSGLNIKDMLVTRDRSHNGARMFVQYLLPNETREIAGAPVSLRFLMWNTHDGSRSASGRAGYFNWVCANQSVRGEELDAFSVRHSGNDPNSAVTVKIENLVLGAKAAIVGLERMSKWAQFQIIDATAVNIFEQIPAANPTLVGALSTEWLKAKTSAGPNGGETLWALYNVLTDWATHKVGKGANVSNALVERQERIAKMMRGKVWQELEAVA